VLKLVKRFSCFLSACSKLVTSLKGGRDRGPRCDIPAAGVMLALSRERLSTLELY